MKKTIFTVCLAIAIACTTNAQVGIGIPTTQIHPSAQLDVSSTTKGFLPPRMTESERNAIASPAAGLMVFCTNCGQHGEWQGFNGSAWTNMVGAAASPDPDSTPRVTIGTQVWTTQNLNVSTYRNGDPIPKVEGAEWAVLTTGAYCYYNNDSATYAAVYGKLYNWYAVNDSRGLAPAGYHIPSNLEWTTLATTLGGNDAGTAMKSTIGWSNNGNGTNSSGFSALPGGFRNSQPIFELFGSHGLWWSSTYWSPNEFLTLAGNVFIWSDQTNLNVWDANNGADPGIGLSVRCLRD